MKKYSYVIADQFDPSVDFTVIQRERDGLEIIHSTTGTHYSLLEGMCHDKLGQVLTSDFMFIMRLELDDDGEYIYADDAFIDYIAGAEYINKLEEYDLQGVFKYIDEYENKLLHK